MLEIASANILNPNFVSVSFDESRIKDIFHTIIEVKKSDKPEKLLEILDINSAKPNDDSLHSS